MKAVRSISRSDSSPQCSRYSDKILYLTFDDGPDPFGTPAVLECLKRLKVSATFFLVAQRAQQFPALFAQIQSDGHAIGNHSLDHGYRNFFRGKRAMLDWINQSETYFEKVTGSATVGFRPPAGVRTPELHWALKQLRMPLVLWRKRFFDHTFLWTPARAQKSLGSTHPGDIILLHDRQRIDRLPIFLQALQVYVEEARKQGYKFSILKREACVELGALR